MDRPQRVFMCVSTVTGDMVRNKKGEELGKIEELMIDLESGRIAYVVGSSGGFLGVGDRLHAIPWSALTVNMAKREFIIDVQKEQLERAPGFDGDNWPPMMDREWDEAIHGYYGSKPYWYGPYWDGAATRNPS